MANTLPLFEHWSPEQVAEKLSTALALAKNNPDLLWGDLQENLHIGSDDAFCIHHWLADNYLVKPHIKEHWVRMGRTYVLNNPSPSLPEMAERLNIGTQAAFHIMLILMKRGVIHLMADHSFERRIPGTTIRGFEKQIKAIARKYRNRCEPELLERRLFIHYERAFRLAVHAREKLHLRWRGPWAYTPLRKTGNGEIMRIADTISRLYAHFGITLLYVGSHIDTRYLHYEFMCAEAAATKELSVLRANLVNMLANDDIYFEPVANEPTRVRIAVGHILAY